ncbi:hypothetical protein V5O48_007509 [Marasmius crinis-equi]|uniref:Uncharacterized protein n=1 Tax=Marasmius crinis-equi TaxID=585013 RepID=A0ABR3FGP4_9AGAR
MATAYHSNSIDPGIISTLTRIAPLDVNGPGQYLFRRLSLSSVDSMHQFSEELLYDIERPTAGDGPQKAQSLTSLPFIAKQRLWLARFDVGYQSRMHIAELAIKDLPELQLRRVGHVYFDDGLATAILLSGDLGQIIVLRYC